MDLHIFFKCFIFLGLIIQFSNGANNDFAILILSQQWPKTVCISLKKPAEQCNLPESDEWTIHGIWPSKKKEIGPFYCNSVPFQREDLRSIIRDLQNKWIDVKNRNPDGFWKYEWEKHGTCSVVLNSLNTQQKYFQKAIDFHTRYNIRNILSTAGILPGNNYPIQQILNRIQENLQVTTQVSCYKTGNNQYLQEIRICFDKQLNLIGCEDYVKSITNCNRNMNVEYPNTVP